MQKKKKKKKKKKKIDQTNLVKISFNRLYCFNVQNDGSRTDADAKSNL